MNDKNNNDKSIQNGLATLIALQILTVVVLAGTFWLTHQDLRNVSESIGRLGQVVGGQAQLAKIDNWREYIHPHNPAIGPVEAEVVIIAYSDFQCPFCKNFAQSTHKQLVQEFRGEVRMVFKHLPLEQIHPQAMIAAIAGQCANRAGSFWELHDLLFEYQDSLSSDMVLSLGRSIGLGEGYASCILNEDTRVEVEQDLEDARSAGIVGTPTFVVNGEVLQGMQSFKAFEGIIKS